MPDADSRAAFLATLRAVIDQRGQRVDARDRLYLAEAMPTLIVWGAHDPVIPVAHGAEAHEAMPGSRFEVLDAGHFPQLEEPYAFTELMTEFIEDTVPASLRAEDLRDLVRSGARSR
jgi:pimeloyl-ACP methyl ester carboxylesterase